MIAEPKVSVISACYNHGKYINDMLQSVLSQTFPDFEVIIVNDGSTDNTAEILNKIRHEKVKIIHTSNNGPSVARNIAIESARAPIIMNLDADDKIAPDLLERAYNIFCSDPDSGIVYSDAECFGAKSGKFEIGEYSIENMISGNRITSLAFFKKSDWKFVGGFSEDFIYGLEDWDFWLSIIQLGRRVHKIPERLVFYRTYKDQTVSRSGNRKSDRMKMLISINKIFQRHNKLIMKYPAALKYYTKIESKLNNENFLIRLLRNFYYNLHLK